MSKMRDINILKSRNTKLLSCFAFSLVVIFTTLIIGIMFRLSAKTIAVFCIAQVFAVYVPGLALFNLLYKDSLDIVKEIVISYAFGYVINIAIYMVTFLVGLKIYMLEMTVGISIISIIYLLVSKDYREHKRILSISWSEVIIVFVVLFFTLFAYAGNHISPLIAEGQGYDRDVQYWVNNAVGLSINFPPENAFADGIKLTYHYFSSLQIAYLSLVTGIDIFNLSFVLYALPKSILCAGAVIYLMEILKVTTKKKVICIVIFLFATGVEEISIVSWVHHMILMPFGCDLGIAFGILFLAEFIRQLSHEQIQTDCLIGSILFCFACTGQKGPIATILLVFPGVVCLLWLFQKKYAQCFTYGVSLVTAYLLVAVGCAGALGLNGRTAAPWRLSIYSIEEIANRYLVSDSRWINAFFSVAIRIFLSNPPLIILFMISCIGFFAKFRQFSYKDKSVYVASVITAFVGMLFWQLINARGNSEMYFMMAAYIPMLIIISHYAWNRRWNFGIIRYMLIVVIAFGSYQFLFNAYGGEGVVWKTIYGIDGLNSEELHEEIIPNSIQKEDVLALEWIRKNTLKDSVIIADRAVLLDDRSYYYYAMFCERQMYLEGTSMLIKEGDIGKLIDERKDLIRRIFRDNDVVALEEASTLGDYLVQTKWLSPDFKPDSQLIKLVYSTESINVYEFIK